MQETNSELSRKEAWCQNRGQVYSRVKFKQVAFSGCIIILWVTRYQPGGVKSARLPRNPCGSCESNDNEADGGSLAKQRRLFHVNPIYFVPGKGGESETRKPFSGWAPNGDATGDLWTTCRCYGPINSRHRRHNEEPLSDLLLGESLRRMFGCLLTYVYPTREFTATSTPNRNQRFRSLHYSIVVS